MKLVGSLLCVAALSVVGCADVETTGGGQGEGIAPEKIEFVDPESVPESTYPQLAGMQLQPGGELPADAICDGCVMTAFKLPEDNGAIDEVRLVKDGGVEVCRIYLKDDALVLDECGWPTP